MKRCTNRGRRTEGKNEGGGRDALIGEEERRDALIGEEEQKEIMKEGEQ